MAFEVPVCDQVDPVLLGVWCRCQMATVGIAWQNKAARFVDRKPKKRKKKKGRSPRVSFEGMPR